MSGDGESAKNQLVPVEAVGCNPQVHCLCESEVIDYVPAMAADATGRSTNLLHSVSSPFTHFPTQ